MTTTLQRSAKGTPINANDRKNPTAIPSIPTAAGRLRTRFAAVRVSFNWLGVRKTLNAEQKNRAAESFGAEGQFLSAAKKLLDTRHEAFQAVTTARHRIVSYWKLLSLPYPEPGVRLLKQGEIESFNAKLTEFRQELIEAVDHLDTHYSNLQSAARERLGSLYNPDDYPATLRGMFSVEWDFPSVEPPEYLLRLNPQLYQQEQNRISARFDEAVKLAEEAFVGEFSKLVSHLVERLSGHGVEGEKKVFRDTAITNLTEFFQRFKNLNVSSNAELDHLVETAQNTLSGVKPHIVRSSDSLRQQVTTELSAVQSVLDGMLIDQPRRRILRTAGVSPAAAGEA